MMVFLIFVFVFVAIQVFIHPQLEVSITQGRQHNFDVECEMKMCFTKIRESGIKLTSIFLSATVFLLLYYGVFYLI